jgi:plastocyanin
MMHTLTIALVSAFSFLTLTTAATSTTTAAFSTSSTIDVQVGQNYQLTFSPSSVTASQGATINFHFYPANHSVGESLVRTPCRYTRDGIWSGFVPVSSGVAVRLFSPLPFFDYFVF